MRFQKVSPYFWFAVLALVYLFTSLVVPVSKHSLTTLHLSLAQYRLLIVIVIVPYILIWFAAFYAFLKSKQYAATLKKAPEGNAFKTISTGIGVMAWGLAVPAILSVILRGIAAEHPQFENTTTVINNYATLLVPLIAFTLIGNGSRYLSELVGGRPTLRGIRIFVLAFLVLGVYYTSLVLSALYRHDNPYHLSRYVLLLTIVVPYLFAWFMGLMSCYDLAMYAKKIRGLLYKRALTSLYAGIATIIASSIFIQFVGIVYAYKNNLSLNSLVLLIYILLLIEAVGFLLLSTGARRLKRIEEI